MNPRHRDGLLALAVTALLLCVARRLGYDRADLLRADATVVGAGGALALEVAMAADPQRSRALWYRRETQVVAVALVVLGGGGLAAVAGPFVLAALLSGLAAYFLLLVGVLAGVVPGAEEWFDRGTEGAVDRDAT